MKHILFLGVCWCMLLRMAPQATAQDYRAYRFISEKDGSALTVSNGSMTNVEAQTGENRLTQLFMLKRVGGGKLLIVSADNPDLYLQRSGSSVVVGSINDSNYSNCEWELVYAGYPYCMIANPGNSQNALKANNGTITLGTLSALSSNSDSSGSQYRFKLETVSNTF